MTCIAIIPARGGSRRIQRKNIKEFHGKPIIAYSIEAAKESGLFDEVWVSTDDDQVAITSIRCGADFAYKRPKELSDDNIGTLDVVRYHVNREKQFNDDDMLCCIYATAPLMSVTDLKQGHILLKNSPQLSHVISVGYPPLQDAAQFYWSSVLSLRMGVDYFEIDTGIVRVDANRVCDINTPEDWSKAEQMYAALHGRRA